MPKSNKMFISPGEQTTAITAVHIFTRQQEQNITESTTRHGFKIRSHEDIKIPADAA
jgi:hypothetical protein